MKIAITHEGLTAADAVQFETEATSLEGAVTKYFGESASMVREVDNYIELADRAKDQCTGYYVYPAGHSGDPHDIEGVDCCVVWIVDDELSPEP